MNSKLHASLRRNLPFRSKPQNGQKYEWIIKNKIACSDLYYIIMCFYSDYFLRRKKNYKKINSNILHI